MSRELDVVLFGATGYTGKLCVEYLQRRAPASLRWAVAGRSAAKLAELGLGVPRIVASSDDEASLRALATRTKVVISTVGPYAHRGLPLVRACAAEGTHYLDLTGEVQFTRQSIDACHEAARHSGACIIHSSGFDSIPSDLGVLYLSHHLHGLARATLYVERMRGGFSGGTAQSALTLMDDAARSSEVRSLLADPYALTPHREPGPDVTEDPRAHFDPLVGTWTAPFVMAQINTRVVRRSNALLGYPYGKDFRYDERTMFPRGPKGMLLARAFAAGFGLVFQAGRTGLGRAALRQLLPSAGAGPTREARERGMFRIAIRGESKAGQRGVVRIVGHSDPGYGETAKMLVESALLLAEITPPPGVNTPASALGLPLVERLRAAGMEWTAGES